MLSVLGKSRFSRSKEVDTWALVPTKFLKKRSRTSGAIVREKFYLIFPMSHGRTNMHIGRVFVAKNAVFDFCTLPPVGSNGSIVAVERKLDRFDSMCDSGQASSILSRK